MRHLRWSRRRPVLVAALLASALWGGAAGAGTLAPRAAAPPGAFPFAEYDALLKKYTDAEGRVDYDGLRQKDAATVERLYASLAATGPDKTPALYQGRDAQLAYYLSAYNLLVWKNVLHTSPRRVDEKLYAFFRAPEFQVDGKEVDLDDLEKKVIRKRFPDGRLHFALNCASGGCPKLSRDAFAPGKVQGQLDSEARRFCNEKRNVDHDPAQRRVKLSLIFKWYREDFGGSDEAVLAFINQRRAPDRQIPAGTKIDHAEYDWRLNDKSLPLR